MHQATFLLLLLYLIALLASAEWCPPYRSLTASLTGRDDVFDITDPTFNWNIANLQLNGGGSMIFSYEISQFTDYNCEILRVKSAQATITQRDLGSGSEPTSLSRRYVQGLRTMDESQCAVDAGHILANSLGGPGIRLNVFPQNPSVNSGHFGNLEIRIAACLKASSTVQATLSWNFIYEDLITPPHYRSMPLLVQYNVTYQPPLDYTNAKGVTISCGVDGGTYKNYFFDTLNSLNLIPNPIPPPPASNICPFVTKACRSNPCPQPNQVMSVAIGGSDELMTVTLGSTAYEFNGGSCNIPIFLSAKVVITTANLKKGKPTDETSRIWVKMLNIVNNAPNKCSVQAGHILANQLGGLAVPGNIFPQAKASNDQFKNEMEDQIAKCLRAGAGVNSMTLQWAFAYDADHTTVPSQIIYTATPHVSNDAQRSAACFYEPRTVFSDNTDAETFAELNIPGY